MSVVRTHLVRPALVGAAVAALALPLAAPASATYPGTNGRISFHQTECDDSNPDEVHCWSNIWTVKPDGSGRVQVTDVGLDQFATLSDWSSNSARLAYDVDDGLGVQVWVANADGSGATQVTTGDGFHGDPVWNPAGTQLAIDTDWGEYEQDSSRQGIWVIPVGTGVTKATPGVRQLTSIPKGIDFDSEPSWSPDGGWVAFTRFKSCSFREHGRQGGQPYGCTQAVHKVRADGTGLTQLTPWGMVASYPNWSPDGSKLTFDACDSGKTGCRGDVWVMNSDGSGKTRLTKSPPTGQLGSTNRFDLRNNPDFSPDGSRIVFTHWCADGGTELVTIAVTGGPETAVVGCDGVFHNKADWGSAA